MCRLCDEGRPQDHTGSVRDSRRDFLKTAAVTGVAAAGLNLFAARPAAADDAFTRGVQEMNRMVYASRELFPVLIPLRDGVTVCRKA